MTTFDFEDGNGPVPAHRHMNPDGTEGGLVADTAYVADTCCIGPDAQVFGNAQVFDDAWVSGNARIFGADRITGNTKISSGTPNKSLNHKSIIDAFEEVHKEFSLMNETEFKEMINESNLDTLGETNKPKETKKKLYCINCKYIKCYYPYPAVCEHPTNMVETSGVYKCCVEPIETIKTLNKNNECKLYKKKWYKFWVK